MVYINHWRRIVCCLALSLPAINAHGLSRFRQRVQTTRRLLCRLRPEYMLGFLLCHCRSISWWLGVTREWPAFIAYGRWEDFAGVEDNLGIKDLFDIPHRQQFGALMHSRHIFSLLDANAVFAGQTASHIYRAFNHLPTGGVDALHQFLVLGVRDEEQRMQVPIAGVEHVPGLQIVARADLIYLDQHLGQATAGHGDIDGIIGRRETRHRPGRAFAGKPDPGALIFVLRDMHVVATMRAQDLCDLLHLCIQALRVAIHLDDQYRARIQWQTGACKWLDDIDDLLIHHLHGGRDQPRCDDG